MVHSPLPKDLRETCDVAAKILREFTIPTATKGPDSVIPGNIISGCKGIAIITIAKAGFLVTARAGAGLVVARTAAGWSAPSALGVAGIGGGFELGVEITDFLLVLNTDRAVSAFSKGTNVTFGANLTIAVGPLGRNAEASVSARSVASVYSYSKSKGLFGGISLEASTLIERKETNHKFYGDNSLRACAILQGDVMAPDGARNLYTALGEADSAARRGGGSFDMASESSSAAPSESRSVGSGWAGGGGGGGGGRPPPRARPSVTSSSSRARPSTGASTGINLGGGINPTVPKAWERNYTMSSAGRASTTKLDIVVPGPKHQVKADTSDWTATNATAASLEAWGSAPVVAKKRVPAPSSTTSTASTWSSVSSAYPPHSTADSWDSSASSAYPPPAATTMYPPAAAAAAPPPAAAAPTAMYPPASMDDVPVAEAPLPVGTAHALFDFSSAEDGDLSFSAGDSITLLTKTPSQNDWWEGELNGVTGIFPANYIHVDA